MEEELQKQLLASCEALTQAGFPMERVRRQSEQFGAVRAVQNYLRAPCDLALLKKAGVLAKSVEALVVRSEFGELFTDAEVNDCFAALCAEGYFSAKA